MLKQNETETDTEKEKEKDRMKYTVNVGTLKRKHLHRNSLIHVNQFKKMHNDE